MVVTNAAFGIDEVMRRPALVVEGSPDRVVVVDCDRIVNLEVPGHGCALSAIQAAVGTKVKATPFMQ